MPARFRLGRTDIEVTAVGLGCWQFSCALAGALTRAGRAGGDVVVATKWFPFFRRHDRSKPQSSSA